MMYLCNNKNYRMLMMRIVLLLFLTLSTVAASAQYRYKNLEVTASSRDGKVIYDGSSTFTLSDSLVNLYIRMEKRRICSVTISNRSTHVIGVMWKHLNFVNNLTEQYTGIDDAQIDNPREGVQNIYIGGTDTFFFKQRNNIIVYAIMKRRDSKISLNIDLIIDNKAVDYKIDFYNKIL